MKRPAATSIRLTEPQKRRLESARRVVERRARRRLTHGEIVEALAEAVARSPALLDALEDRLDLDLRKDRLFDPTFAFDMGETDARTLDDVIYGEE
ncbi:MAG TPA: hypothetical protein VJ397_09595 [Thermoplasmata archaeon]|nr:hypothetical protein [Thermoplasmata archaeon]